MGYTSAFFVFLVFGSRRVVFPLLLIKHRASKIQWPRREDRRYKNGRQVLLLRLLRAWFKRRRFEVTVRTVRGRVKTLSQIMRLLARRDSFFHAAVCKYSSGGSDHRMGGREHDGAVRRVAQQH